MQSERGRRRPRRSWPRAHDGDGAIVGHRGRRSDDFSSQAESYSVYWQSTPGGSMSTITPHLWFDTQARAAAQFYADVFPDSSVTGSDTLTDTPSGDTD